MLTSDLERLPDASTISVARIDSHVCVCVSAANGLATTNTHQRIHGCCNKHPAHARNCRNSSSPCCGVRRPEELLRVSWWSVEASCQRYLADHALRTMDAVTPGHVWGAGSCGICTCRASASIQGARSCLQRTMPQAGPAPFSESSANPWYSPSAANAVPPHSLRTHHHPSTHTCGQSIIRTARRRTPQVQITPQTRAAGHLHLAVPRAVTHSIKLSGSNTRN